MEVLFVNKLLIIPVLMLLLIGCVTTGVNTEPSKLTPGMAGKHIIKGETTQTEVLEIFGPPDLVTKRGTVETWAFDRISTEEAHVAGILGGGGLIGAGAVGGIVSGGKRTATTKTIMLLVYFNEGGIVKDYSVTATKF